MSWPDSIKLKWVSKKILALAVVSTVITVGVTSTGVSSIGVNNLSRTLDSTMRFFPKWDCLSLLFRVLEQRMGPAFESTDVFPVDWPPEEILPLALKLEGAVLA